MDDLLIEYTVKPGDNLSVIIRNLYDIYPGHPRYTEIQNQIQQLNPSITNPNLIYPNQVIRLLPLAYDPKIITAKPKPRPGPFADLPLTPTPYTVQLKSQRPFTEQIEDLQVRQTYWALSWLQHHYNWLNVPGAVGFGVSAPGGTRRKIRRQSQSRALRADESREEARRRAEKRDQQGSWPSYRLSPCNAGRRCVRDKSSAGAARSQRPCRGDARR